MEEYSNIKKTCELCGSLDDIPINKDIDIDIDKLYTQQIKQNIDKKYSIDLNNILNKYAREHELDTEIKLIFFNKYNMPIIIDINSERNYLEQFQRIINYELIYNNNTIDNNKKYIYIDYIKKIFDIIKEINTSIIEKKINNIEIKKLMSYKNCPKDCIEIEFTQKNNIDQYNKLYNDLAEIVKKFYEELKKLLNYNQIYIDKLETYIINNFKNIIDTLEIYNSLNNKLLNLVNEYIKEYQTNFDIINKFNICLTCRLCRDKHFLYVLQYLEKGDTLLYHIMKKIYYNHIYYVLDNKKKSETCKILNADIISKFKYLVNLLNRYDGFENIIKYFNTKQQEIKIIINNKINNPYLDRDIFKYLNSMIQNDDNAILKQISNLFISTGRQYQQDFEKVKEEINEKYKELTINIQPNTQQRKNYKKKYIKYKTKYLQLKKTINQ